MGKGVDLLAEKFFQETYRTVTKKLPVNNESSDDNCGF
jgi:hypothetical protein